MVLCSPKGGKALLGKLVCVFFFFALDQTPSASSHWRLGKGMVHPKEAGWWTEDGAAAILPPPCRCCGTHSSAFGCCGGLLAHKRLPCLQKNCGDNMCLIPALHLRGLFKGITNLQCAAFAPRALHICLIPSGVSAAQGYDMFLGRAVNGKKRSFDQSSCSVVVWWPL